MNKPLTLIANSSLKVKVTKQGENTSKDKAPCLVIVIHSVHGHHMGAVPSADP